MAAVFALEEHFAIPETLGDSEQYARGGAWSGLSAQLLDLGAGRIAEMDRHGIAHAVLSLNSPAVQAIWDPSHAVTVARQANDILADAVARHPARFSGFAALPLQDVEAACRELERGVRELGFVGALVNGFSQVGDAGRVAYYDEPQYEAFWATAERLGVPIYLHPRDPLLSREPVYEGHPWFQGSAWAFGVETAIHALRLMASGVFDRHPALRLILGHLGEGIPYNVWRLDHRLRKSPRGIPAKQSMGHYLRQNLFLTTSGNFRDSTLAGAISEVGIERVLFSVDYPFEDPADAVSWLAQLSLPTGDVERLVEGNARSLLGITR